MQNNKKFALYAHKTNFLEAIIFRTMYFYTFVPGIGKKVKIYGYTKLRQEKNVVTKSAERIILCERMRMAAGYGIILWVMQPEAGEYPYRG